MGDIGDYWREHKEYKRAKSRGMTVRQMQCETQKSNRERNLAKRLEHEAKCTLQCECGRWFLDVAAHNAHKSKTGRKGHRVVETKASGALLLKPTNTAEKE